MDLQFTERLKVWLDTPSKERNLDQGATYLLQLTGNRIMYQNIIRNLERNRDIIEYQIQKYYNFRVRDLTHSQVEEMDAQVAAIIARHFNDSATKSDTTPSSDSHPDGSPLPIQGEGARGRGSVGKRSDHDTLPLEIQSLYVENLSILQQMRELHLQLRMLSTENSTCPDSERYPFLKELIDLDKKYHHNWDVYDHFVIGVTEIPKEQTAEDESKSALRAFNLYKGKYKKNPTDDFKAKMLEAYSRVADPKEKLTEELKELGVME